MADIRHINDLLLICVSCSAMPSRTMRQVCMLTIYSSIHCVLAGGWLRGRGCARVRANVRGAALPFVSALLHVTHERGVQTPTPCTRQRKFLVPFSNTSGPQPSLARHLDE